VLTTLCCGTVKTVTAAVAPMLVATWCFRLLPAGHQDGPQGETAAAGLFKSGCCAVVFRQPSLPPSLPCWLPPSVLDCFPQITRMAPKEGQLQLGCSAGAVLAGLCL
jgi:hypothetical protein